MHAVSPPNVTIAYYSCSSFPTELTITNYVCSSYTTECNDSQLIVHAVQSLTAKYGNGDYSHTG